MGTWSYEGKKVQEKEHMGLKDMSCPVKCKHFFFFMCLMWHPAIKLGSKSSKSSKAQEQK